MGRPNNTEQLTVTTKSIIDRDEAALYLGVHARTVDNPERLGLLAPEGGGGRGWGRKKRYALVRLEAVKAMREAAEETTWTRSDGVYLSRAEALGRLKCDRGTFAEWHRGCPALGGVALVPIPRRAAEGGGLWYKEEIINSILELVLDRLRVAVDPAGLMLG